MKQFRPDRYLVLSVILLIVIWLMVGISKDDEFGDHTVFLKYRPVPQVYFRSPLGMQDMPPGYPPDLVAEEAVYDEFVNQQHWSDGSLPTSLAGVLLLLAPVLLVVGIRRQFKARRQ